MRILVVDDDENDHLLLRRALRNPTWAAQTVRVDTAAEARHETRAAPFDVAIVEYDIPGFSGPVAIQQLQEADPDLPVLLVAGSVQAAEAVEALRAGARDYVPKDQLARLVPAIDREIAERRERQARKRAENELEGSRRELEALVHERTRDLENSRDLLRFQERLATVGTFAAGIAHELNNPLGAILNAAQFALLLKGDPSFEEEAARTLELVTRESQRCGRVVRSVLQSTRGEASEKWPQDLHETVRATAFLAQKPVSEAHFELRLELDSRPASVSLNPLQIEQVLLNLIHNAIEAGGEEHLIVLQSRVEQEQVILECRDRGRGMTPTQLSHAFDPFYTTRRQAGGTGLGLSVARGLVREHGGDLLGISEPGLGTTMELRLPLCATAP